MGIWKSAIVLLCPLFLSVCSDVTKSSYKAAVYEHVVIMPTEFRKAVNRSRALKTMYENLDVYEAQANKARRLEANILIFPEDGIYGFVFSRDALYPYLESIPDPENTKWSPCADPTRFPSSEVQHRLSCMAMKNKMYIAADMGDKIACDKRKDPKCPDDGRYQYNTAVVYDPDGTLVAKYHKRHLFSESQFDTPEVEIKFFDTPFGRFGFAICFDLLFHDPAVAMVTRHNVTNVLFPTAWRDALPLLSAIGYHSSFARALGVNLLGSNVHLPLLRFQGSGVYTPKGMASFYYDNHLLSSGKLMVTEIDILKEPAEVTRASTHSSTKVRTPPLSNLNENWVSEEEEFFADVFHDRYTFRALRETSGEINVCDGGVCCYLKYEIAESSDHLLFRDLFAFGVFDGSHTYEGQYYLQVCTLLKCSSRYRKSTCGATTFTSSTIFKTLSIQGEFETGYVYPQVVLSSNGQLELARADQWDFFAPASFNGTVRSSADGDKYTFGMSSSSTGFQKPLLSATLYGRYYSRDNDTAVYSKTKSNILQSNLKKSSIFSSIFGILSSWYKILARVIPF